MVKKLLVMEDESPYSILRRVEDYLLEHDNVNGQLLFRRRNETTVKHDDIFIGHDKDKVVALALEYGVEIEYK
jgi:hypothetical protein